MVKEYIIDLDLPQAERWRHILDDHKHLFPELETEIGNIISMFGYNNIYSMCLNTGIYLFSSKVLYYDELKSISDAVGLSLDKILIMQLLYELSAACTTIVHKVEGQMTMLRTLDWDMSFLKKITIDVEFRRAGQKLFKATTWVGYVGILTAMNNDYSVAINYRRTKEVTLSAIGANLMSIITMKWPIGYRIRTVLESGLNLRDSLECFRGSLLVSPTYITVCTKSGGHIIVRDPDSVVKELTDLPLIQTNLDDDKSCPNIVYSLERRELSKGVLADWDTLTNISDKLSKFPIFNEETIYSNIMIPATGEYYSSTDSHFPCV